MAQTAANVRVGFDGAFYVADSYPGTSPADATTPLTGFTEVGYISDAGVTKSHEDDVNEIVAWQRADVVRKTITKSDVSFQFNIIETNKLAVELYYGAKLEADNKSLKEVGFKPVRISACLDVIDGDYIHRMFLPEAEVVERGDMTFVTEDAVAYDLTVTAYPDTDQVKIYHYWNEVVAGTAGIRRISASDK